MAKTNKTSTRVMELKGDVGNIKDKKTKILGIIIVVLKFVACAVLVGADAVLITCLFSSTWCYDHYYDETYPDFKASIYHTLWDFSLEGDDYSFAKHNEAEWQDWKKPLIRYGAIAMALGISATLVQAFLTALHFVHPHKPVKVALLVAILLQSYASGGLVIKMVMKYNEERPIIGFSAAIISSGSPILTTINSTGYILALSAAALYMFAGLLATVLVVLTLIKRPSRETQVRPVITAVEQK